jgi:hypothetical protein
MGGGCNYISSGTGSSVANMPVNSTLPYPAQNINEALTKHAMVGVEGRHRVRSVGSNPAPSGLEAFPGRQRRTLLFC